MGEPGEASEFERGGKLIALRDRRDLFGKEALSATRCTKQVHLCFETGDLIGGRCSAVSD